MSRRKQARPIRLLEDGPGPLPTSLPTGESSGSGSEDEAGSSGEAATGRQESTPVFGDLREPKGCATPLARSPAENEDVMMQPPEEELERTSEGEKRQEEARRQRQDAENNNSLEEGETEPEPEPDTPDAEVAPVGFPFRIPGGHVTLEALQNTKVAVAQFAATAMANNADNTAALQELAVLQSTLYTLQHQQMMQLNLIQQLQQQLQITRPKEGSPSSSPDRPLPPVSVTVPQSAPVVPPPQPRAGSTPSEPREEVPLTPPASQALPAALDSSAPATPAAAPPRPEPSPPLQPSLPPCSISSAFASSIITNLDPPPSPSEPNTLEMLQRRAQEVLDNASQGLLANNLADELAFRKNGGKNPLSPYDSKTGGRNEPFFKHRCRYCGKVFGSDSALQIHIRSHTGERPFKCNVCGSRFTTKGNLKVHFQRHTSKFPHIKMNPNPIPEHLDKYHPPLLAQMGAHQSLPPGGPPPAPHHHGQYPPGPQFPPGIPVYRPPPPPPHDLVLPLHARNPDSVSKPVLPISLFGPRQEQDVPENLSKAVSSAHSSPLPSDHSDQYKREREEEPRDLTEPRDMDGGEAGNRLSPKREAMEIEPDIDPDQERYPSPPPYDDCSFDSKYTGEDMPGDGDSPGVDKNEDSLQDQPENLSNKSTSDMGHFSLTPDHRIAPPLHFPDIISPPSSNSSGSVHRLTPRGFVSTPENDPAKDPAVYSTLLPRPGSNDNSWESLIEVTKTSETSKLQQLVDNIEHKLTDPNQCIICHRVLSCKSALQMHYRTHTGERPFRCRICGRAFTTKGNLKTHMGVHRIKPPVRTLHQCPVCHKKFTNGLVLQQHIRLHTGEPTDLTPQQIQAAEIRDYPPPPPLRPYALQPYPPPPGHPYRDAPSDHGLRPAPDTSFGRDLKRLDPTDYIEDGRPDSISPISDAVFSDSLSALENQVRTITTISSSQHSSSPTHKISNRSPEELCNNRQFTPITVNGEKSPGSRSPSESEGQLTPSPVQPQSQSQEGACVGALDLTPRGSAAAAAAAAAAAPVAIFPATFGLLPPGSSPLITTALSSLTSSVLTSTAFNPLGLSVGPPGRGNTTCNLCFKTFACNSALEIHYRSHTKERPFKCTICERGFSTKGNMKQHMLTHKIRDMPPHLFEQKTGAQQQQPGPQHQQPGPQHQQPGPQHQQPLPQHQQMGPQHHQQGESSSELPSLQEPLPAPAPAPKPPPSPPKLELGVKRSPPQTDLPLPKRQPSLPKHLCNVCNKNFSSSSALQIHMRTHTGDKPFRCTICHKAFTTKGNLKVHMGTHMWTNGASRRGRRMSLELPPLPKDSEFLHRRPDLFYPYLPAPFLNGMHHKLSEMSQSAGVGHNGMPTFGNGGGGGGERTEAKSGEGGGVGPQHPGQHPGAATGPPMWADLQHFDRKPPQPEELHPPLWELHYDRNPPHQPAEEHPPQSPPPPPQPQPPRGEGLAA